MVAIGDIIRIFNQYNKNWTYYIVVDKNENDGYCIRPFYDDSTMFTKFYFNPTAQINSKWEVVSSVSTP